MRAVEDASVVLKKMHTLLPHEVRLRVVQGDDAPRLLPHPVLTLILSLQGQEAVAHMDAAAKTGYQTISILQIGARKIAGHYQTPNTEEMVCNKCGHTQPLAVEWLKYV
jgi:hypothetical protein